MRPVLTADYVLDGWHGHAEYRGDFAVFHTVPTQLTDATNGFSVQSGTTVSNAPTRSGYLRGVGALRNGYEPTLLNHVSDVIGLRSKEKVVGADARAIVAAMQNAQTVGDRTVGEQP